MSELLAFLGHGEDGFPAGHPFGKIRVSPDMPGSPDVWLLGSSMWSAAAAAEFGLPYAFAHFFSALTTRAAIEAYKRHFVPSHYRPEPEAMAAVGVICAETDEEAQYLHASVRLLQRRIRQGDRRPVASPDDARRELQAFGGEGVAPSEEGEWPRYIVGHAGSRQARPRGDGRGARHWRARRQHHLLGSVGASAELPVARGRHGSGSE